MISNNQIDLYKQQQPIKVKMIMTYYHPHPLMEDKNYSDKWNCFCAIITGKCLNNQKKDDFQLYGTARYRCAYANCAFKLCDKCALSNISYDKGNFSSMHDHLLFEIKISNLIPPCSSKKLKGSCSSETNLLVSIAKTRFNMIMNKKEEIYQCCLPGCDFWLCKHCFKASQSVPLRIYVMNHPHPLYGIKDKNPWSCGTSYLNPPQSCLRKHIPTIPALRDTIKFSCLYPFCNYNICDLCANSSHKTLSQSNFQSNEKSMNSSCNLNIQKQFAYTNDSLNNISKFKSRVHNHSLNWEPPNKNVGWFCSILKLNKACLRNHQMKFDIRSHDKYHCSQCDFSLCDLCMKATAYDEIASNVNFAPSINKIIANENLQVVANDVSLNLPRKNEKQLPLIMQNLSEDKKNTQELFFKKISLLSDEKRCLMNELTNQLIFEIEQTLKTTNYYRSNMGQYYLEIMPEYEEFFSLKDFGNNPKIFDSIRLNNILIDAKYLRQELNKFQS